MTTGAPKLCVGADGPRALRLINCLSGPRHKMTSPLSVELDTSQFHSGTPDADRAAAEVPFIR